MIKLIIQLNGVDPKNGEDICLSKFESSSYNDLLLWHRINTALKEGAAKVGGSLDCLRPWHVVLTVGITADEEDGFRPAFHLEPEVITKLNAAGASLDFDPYVYS